MANRMHICVFRSITADHTANPLIDALASSFYRYNDDPDAYLAASPNIKDHMMEDPAQRSMDELLKGGGPDNAEGMMHSTSGVAEPALGVYPGGDVTMTGGGDEQQHANHAGGGDTGIDTVRAGATLTYPPHPRNAKPNNNNNTVQTTTAPSTSSSALFPPSHPSGTVRAPQAVSQLNELCQKRGIEPPEYMFDEDMPQRFIPRLKLADREIVLTIDDDIGFADVSQMEGEDVSGAGKKKKEQRFFSSKKAAKEAIAIKGLDLLSGLEDTGPAKEKDEVNWVGKLNEFYQKHPQISHLSTSSALGGHRFNGPTFTETPRINKRTGVVEKHECTCLIPHRPDRRFGMGTGDGDEEEAVYFATKKAAKMNAAKEAYAWLKESGFVDGKS